MGDSRTAGVCAGITSPWGRLVAAQCSGSRIRLPRGAALGVSLATQAGEEGAGGHAGEGRARAKRGAQQVMGPGVRKGHPRDEAEDAGGDPDTKPLEAKLDLTLRRGVPWWSSG